MVLVLGMAGTATWMTKQKGNVRVPVEETTVCPPSRRVRAMYHWKNRLQTTQREDEFLDKHMVERLYVRFFDVTVADNLDGMGLQAVPSATAALSRPKTCQVEEIIPTVYITVEAMKLKDGEGLAKLIWKRVKNMCEYYELGQVEEIQLDCDWTPSTREAYFKVCREMSELCRVSSTIRLHQLREEAPQVSYGVLMLYNTNNLKDPKVRNSILSVEDVKPYLKRASYPLPLDFAYPVFDWYIWFHKGRFCEIVTDKHRADSLRHVGEQVRHEAVEINELLEVKDMVEKQLPQPDGYGNAVIYHLDERMLNKYLYNEIEDIFDR